MTEQQIKEEYENITGEKCINSQGEPDIDYVAWLEQMLIGQTAKNRFLYSDVSRVEVIEAKPCLRHLVQVWCLDDGVPAVTGVAPAHVVSDNEHNIRSCPRRDLGGTGRA